MKIVDAHHHLWDLEHLPYPWLQPDAGPRPFGDHSEIKRNYGMADYAADIGLDLAGSVHVQANSGAADPVAETRWVSLESEGSPWPVAIVGEVSLQDEATEDTLARHARWQAFRGVRIFAGYDDDPVWRQCPDPDLLRSSSVGRLVEKLCLAGNSLDLVVHPRQLEQTAELARAFPDLPIAINHLGQPRASNFAAAATWREGIARAATCGNVFLKLSGLWTIDRDWAPDALAPFLDHAIECFGSSRCMYGSNLPIEKVMIAPQLQIPRLLEALPDLSEPDREDILGGTAMRFYRL